MEVMKFWGQLWPYLGLMIPIYVFAKYLRSPTFSGSVKGFLQKKISDSDLDENDYHVLKENIVVSSRGIFLVDVRTESGWIFCRNKKRWKRQYMGQDIKFDNPVTEIKKKKKEIALRYNIKPKKIHSVIVFAGDGAFRTKRPKDVIYDTDFIDYIKSKDVKILDKDTMKNLIQGRL